MAQWREKCVYCKHSELFAGYVVSCDLAECEYEFNDFTYSNKTEALPKGRWQASTTTKMEEKDE